MDQNDKKRAGCTCLEHDAPKRCTAPGQASDIEIIDLSQRDVGGTWVTGNIDCFYFEALVFPEHAVNANFEIDSSYISKLFLRRASDYEVMFNWDRGADVCARDKNTEVAVGVLTKRLAAIVFPHHDKQESNVEAITTEAAAQCKMLPIRYHRSLGNLREYASEVGWTARRLRTLAITAIRERAEDAIVHERDRGIGHQPNVYSLALCHRRPVWVHFSVEPPAVVIRGFSWDIAGEPLDDRDGGGIVS